MHNNYDEFSDWLSDARRDLERDHEKLSERIEKINYYQKALDVSDELLSELEVLKKENDKLRTETDSLRAQLQEKEVQLSEQRKLTTGMAKKSSEDELIKAIRVFINISKRKSLDKRTHIKDMIRDLADAVKLELPDDLRETLAHLDDEQNEPSQQVFIETLNGTATGQVTQNIGQSEQAKLLVKS